MIKYILRILILVNGIAWFASMSNFAYANEPVEESSTVETTIVTQGASQGDNFSDPNSALPPINDSIDGNVAGRAPIKFIFDANFSPIVGADLFISGLHAYMAIDDTLIPSTQGATGFVPVAGRLGKWILEGVMMNWAAVAQHEYFGHGARAREFNLKVNTYNIMPFRGYTSFNAHEFQLLTPSERAAVDTGGVEANYILAKELRNRWVETKYLDEREGHFYLITALDQPLYVLSTRNNWRNGRTFNFFDDSHDIHSYIKEVNFWHGHPVLNQRDLRRKIVADFFDPYLFYSLFAFGNYLIDGTQGFETPMIPIGNFHYLPGFRIALAPYGPEYQFINYIRGMDQTIQVTLRFGETGTIHSHGATIEVTKLVCSDLLSLDARIDGWHQPRLLKSHFLRRSESKFGGAFSIIPKYQILNNFDLFAQIGYKTTGYMPGEFLKHSPIIRIGFTFKM